MAAPKNQPQNNHDLAERKEIQRAYVEEHYAGPLPHPNHLAAYEKIYPGAAKIIFEMAQSQTTHRQALEKKVINENLSLEKLGTWLTFIGLIGMLITGFVLIYNNKNIPVGVFTMLAPVIVQGINLYWRRQKEPKSLRDKDKEIKPKEK